MEEGEEGVVLRVVGEHEHEHVHVHEIRAGGVVLAMGIRRRELGVPGEKELQGRGILATAARDPGAQAGREVVVVGGGDAACENALILARAGARVTLAHRGHRPTCRREFIRDLENEERITVRPKCQVLRFTGADRLDGVELSGPSGVEVVAARAALVRVGWTPNSGVLPPAWLDEQRFARTDASTRVASARRVFAAGDITGPVSSSVASAMGAGANASRAVVAMLER